MDTKNNILYITRPTRPTRPCDCSFCSQFYIARLQKYRYNRYLEKYNMIDQNIKKYKNDKTDNKNFTLSDLETITYLKSLDCNTDDISKQTNISYSIVEYIIKILSYKI